MSFFAKNIKILREFKKEKQLETCANMGFKTSTWNNYERGVSEPSIDEVLRISEYFNINSSHLLEIDLQNVEVSSFIKSHKMGKNVEVNVEGSVEVKQKKGQKEPCEVCIVKDTLLALKDQIIEGKIQLIHSLEAQIMLLQNQQETKAFEPVKGRKTHTTPKEDRKTA